MEDEFELADDSREDWQIIGDMEVQGSEEEAIVEGEDVAAVMEAVAQVSLDPENAIGEGLAQLHIAGAAGAGGEAASSSSSRLTYLEMLLRGKQQQAASASSTAAASPRRTTSYEQLSWRPARLRVEKVPYLRKDREYGASNATNTAWMDDDEDGMWDLIDAHVGCKISAGVSRARAVVRLPPAILEKKALRIAQKA